MSGEEERPFSREFDRDYSTRNFSKPVSDFGGRSNKEKFQGDYETHKYFLQMERCVKQASNYFNVMRRRIDEEQPEYFEEKGVPVGRFHNDFIKEVCYEEMVKGQHAGRSRQADLLAKHHLNDTMRRLVNGGDKFHPYM